LLILVDFLLISVELTNIKKTNNHPTYQTSDHNRSRHMTLEIQVLTYKCGGVKPVNGTVSVLKIGVTDIQNVKPNIHTYSEPP